jgi:hypothetical protein
VSQTREPNTLSHTRAIGGPGPGGPPQPYRFRVSVAPHVGHRHRSCTEPGHRSAPGPSTPADAVLPRGLPTGGESRLLSFGLGQKLTVTAPPSQQRQSCLCWLCAPILGLSRATDGGTDGGMSPSISCSSSQTRPVAFAVAVRDAGLQARSAAGAVGALMRNNSARTRSANSPQCL